MFRPRVDFSQCSDSNTHIKFSMIPLDSGGDIDRGKVLDKF